jgi:cytochrome c-type biogenesis protein CcmH
MTVFWLVAGLLMAAALFLLLPPLLRQRAAGPRVSRKATNVAVYRDQLRELELDLAAGVVSRDGYEEAKREIERRVLEDVGGAVEEPAPAGTAGRNAAVVVGAALPIAAFILYFAVGNFQALLPGAARNPQREAHSISPEQVRELAGRLAARMEKEPDNVEGWIMLGRSYTALEQFADAARAYGNAVARSGSDAALLADYADALAMARGRSLEGEPEKIILRALAVDPQNVKALALAGTAAFERRDYAAAVGYWERILKIVPEDSEFVPSVHSNIAEARELAKQSGTPAAVARAPDATAAEKAPAGAKAVSGVVQLAPAFAARVAPNDTLFVFARPAEGSRMPLAIIRAQAKDLPFRFRLDDRNAMAQGMGLSSQERVIVGARISKSGNATSQRGDLEGLSPPVHVGAADITVRIESETK